jgi:hypothetical protein
MPPSSWPPTASGKVLAVHNASTADSANVEQYQDTGTPDHNWLIK